MIQLVLAKLAKTGIVAVVASMLGALLMFIIGAVKVAKAYQAYFLLQTGPDSNMAGTAIAYLVQAINGFLIALALMYFGYGVFILFVANKETVERWAAAGFAVQKITELKSMLANMIVIILMVKVLENALTSGRGLGWQDLVLPGAILLLAAAVRVLNLEK